MELSTNAASQQVRHPSAAIIALPTAVAEPVAQHPRRGRYPKGVFGIRGARSARARRQYLAELHAEEIARKEEAISVMAEALFNARRNLALRKQGY